MKKIVAELNQTTRLVQVQTSGIHNNNNLLLSYWLKFVKDR